MNRRRTGSTAPRTTHGRRLVVGVVIALLATTLATLAPQAVGPVAADGNEAPAAPFAARRITTGDGHTCAILTAGSVKCWGLGSVGQLGQDSTANVGTSAGQVAALPAVNLGAGRTATAISAGFNHTCALLDNATGKCWGFGSSGRVGQRQ